MCLPAAVLAPIPVVECSPSSTRLELMRQIYNAESPAPSMHTSHASLAIADGNGNCEPASVNAAAVCVALDTLQAAAAAGDTISADGQTLSNRNGTLTNQQHTAAVDFMQALANCAQASRLSLANLFPSRFASVAFQSLSTARSFVRSFVLVFICLVFQLPVVLPNVLRCICHAPLSHCVFSHSNRVLLPLCCSV